MPSPDIQGQMGVPQQPPPGMGALAAQRPPGGQPAPGAPDPNGSVVAQVEAIKAVLEEMAGIEPIMAPFASRATAILDSGVAAVRSAPQGPGAEGAAGVPGGPGAPPPPGGPGQLPPLA